MTVIGNEADGRVARPQEAPKPAAEASEAARQEALWDGVRKAAAEAVAGALGLQPAWTDGIEARAADPSFKRGWNWTRRNTRTAQKQVKIDRLGERVEFWISHYFDDASGLFKGAKDAATRDELAKYLLDRVRGRDPKQPDFIKDLPQAERQKLEALVKELRAVSVGDKMAKGQLGPTGLSDGELLEAFEGGAELWGKAKDKAARTRANEEKFSMRGKGKPDWTGPWKGKHWEKPPPTLELDGDKKRYQRQWEKWADSEGRLSVMQVPHHGGAKIDHGKLADRLRPRAVVVQRGKTPASDKALDAYRQRGIEVFDTAVDGAIEVTVKKGGELVITTFKTKRRMVIPAFDPDE